MTLRTTSRAIVLAAVGVAAVAATTAPLEGQRRGGFEPRERSREPAPRPYLGIRFSAADPVGEFGELVDQGWGAVIDASFPVDGSGAVRLRGEAGFIVYGHEEQTVCLPVPGGCRVGLDLTTTNNIFHLGIGPELAIPGGPIEPYANATAGLSYFLTHSSLGGDRDFDDFASDDNHSDLVGALGVGGGLRTRISGGGTPIYLDFGVQYRRNGVAEYLREGDIVDHPDGSITIFPNRSEANLVTYRIGVTFGLGGHEGHDRRHGGQW